MVADAIDAGLGGDGNGDDSVHIIIKVWYTHLVYDRTYLSVLESMERLRNLEDTNRNIKVHVLLLWPRCYDKVSWIDCKGDQERISQYAKEIGYSIYLFHICSCSGFVPDYFTANIRNYRLKH